MLFKLKLRDSTWMEKALLSEWLEVRRMAMGLGCSAHL